MDHLITYINLYILDLRQLSYLYIVWLNNKQNWEAW